MDRHLWDAVKKMSKHKTKSAYISGALTGILDANLKIHFYESIGSLCQSISIQPYLPHLNFSLDASVSAQEIFNMDKHHVTEADVVIAYLGNASIGVGMEIAYSEIAKIPLIILYEQEKTVSRLPLGVPNLYRVISFSETTEALSILKETLLELFEEAGPS